MLKDMFRKAIERRSLLGKLLGGGVAALVGARAASAADAPAAAPATLGIKNIGIAVSDIERSTKFYTEVFGFKAEAKPIKIGDALAPLMEVEKLDATIQFIETGGSARIELLAFATPKVTGDGKRREFNHLGLTHLQIKVADLTATLAAVKKAGGTVLENAKIARGDAVQAIFVLDPDGQRLELIP